MKKFLIHILAFVVMTSSYYSHSEELDKAEGQQNLYLRLDVGKSFAKRVKYYDDGELHLYHNDKLKNDYAINIGIGKYLNKNLRADLTISQRNYKLNDHTNSSHSGVSYNATRNQKIRSTALMVNGYYNIDSFNIVTPYLSVGIGLSFNKTSDMIVDVDTPSLHITHSGQTATNFIWQIGLGTVFNISNNIDMDISYKFSDLGKIKTKSGTRNSMFQDDSFLTPGRSFLKMHEIMIGVRYRL